MRQTFGYYNVGRHRSLVEPQFPDFANVISRLRQKGVQLDDGLTSSEFGRIRDELGLVPPPDVRQFLSTVLPVGSYYPNWRGDLSGVHNLFIEPIVPHFIFHVQHNVFWCDDWGDRPTNTNDAVSLAQSRLETVPRLFPLGDTMYLKGVPCTPDQSGNPVFSVRGSDVLHAGRNIVEYLTWLSEPPETVADDPTPVFCDDYRDIPFWTETCRWNNV